MRNTTTEKKITLATVKSFIRKNVNNDLHLSVESRFDGMTDCVENNPHAGMKPANVSGYDPKKECNLGIPGLWFVRGSGDYFTKLETAEFTGFSVWNCCGSWEIAIPKK